MQTVPLQSPTQVLQCGGALVYQLLCGRDVARGSEHAARSANYCYLIVNTLDRTAIALDLAWDVDGVYALAEQLGVKLRGSIYSHFHVDHCGGDPGALSPMLGARAIPGAKEVQDRGGQIYAGQGDADRVQAQCRLSSIAAVSDGDVLDCGDLVLHVVHTPGHSPGSICIYAAPRCLSPRENIGKSPFTECISNADGGLLLTGDTLFVGACGRTDMPDAGMDPQQMASSLARLSTMDPSVVVLPGHNYASVPYTTIGQERAQNESVIFGMRSVPRPPPLPPCLGCDQSGNCGPHGFIIGRKVRIRGLQSDTGKILNGQSAVVEGFSEKKGRYMVRLFSASEPKVLKPDNLEGVSGSCGPCGFFRNETVYIRGLHSAAGSHLNGREGIVKAFDTVKERYAIQVGDEIRLIRPENLDSNASLLAAEASGEDVLQAGSNTALPQHVEREADTSRSCMRSGVGTLDAEGVADFLEARGVSSVRPRDIQGSPPKLEIFFGTGAEALAAEADVAELEDVLGVGTRWDLGREPAAETAAEGALEEPRASPRPPGSGRRRRHDLAGGLAAGGRGRDLAAGRPAEASSAKSAERAPASAVDGQPGTRWTSAYADGQWLSVDLGAARELSRVALRWEAAHARSYYLQGSLDGRTWTILASERGHEGWVVTALRSGSRARYVRMYGRTRATRFGFSIWEMRVYAGKFGTTSPNLATGCFADASSAASAAANAVDGRLDTRWTPECAGDHWLSLDLGYNFNVSRIDVRWDATSGGEYLLQGSLDGRTWTNLACQEASEGWVVGALELVGASRFIRVYCPSQPTSQCCSIGEVQVFAGTIMQDDEKANAALSYQMAAREASPSRPGCERGAERRELLNRAILLVNGDLVAAAMRELLEPRSLPLALGCECGGGGAELLSALLLAALGAEPGQVLRDPLPAAARGARPGALLVLGLERRPPGGGAAGAEAAEGEAAAAASGEPLRRALSALEEAGGVLGYLASLGFGAEEVRQLRRLLLAEATASRGS